MSSDEAPSKWVEDRIKAFETRVKALENLYATVQINHKELVEFLAHWAHKPRTPFYDKAAEALSNKLGDRVVEAMAKVAATDPPQDDSATSPLAMAFDTTHGTDGSDFTKDLPLTAEEREELLKNCPERTPGD